MALNTRISALATAVAQQFNSVKTTLSTKSNVVYWDTVTDSWGSRGASAPAGVMFVSTSDVAATAPSDVNLKTGDIWLKHKDA